MYNIVHRLLTGTSIPFASHTHAQYMWHFIVFKMFNNKGIVAFYIGA